MKFINKYNNIEDYNGDVNRPIHNTVSYIKNEGRIIYTPIPSYIEFADPEVIRVLRDQVGLVFEGNKAKLSDIEGVNSFDDSFYENQVITQFPELRYFTGITSLDETFVGCSNLTTVGDIPEGVTNLYYTFAYCTNLTTAPVIPEGVTDLYYAFSGCSSLTTAPVIPDGVTNLYATFSGCSNLTTAPTIPSSVTDLSYTFRGCSNLTTAPVLPNSVTNLEATFYGCSSLTTAPDIPEGVTDLSFTFINCSSLTTAPVIPSSVTNLNSTFYGCSSIDGIYIINIVTPVSYSSSLPNVQAIYVPDASVSAYKSASGWTQFADNIYPFSEGPFELSGKFADPEVGRVLHANGLIESPTHSTREELATITSLNPSGTTDGSYFYSNEVITQFPELKYFTGLTDLSSTFFECSNLTTVGDIPEGVTNLITTFYICSNLTTAPAIPEGVTDLYGTFYGCTSLTTAPVIPSSVTDFNLTFFGCMSLTTAPAIPEGITSLSTTFRHCSSLTTAPIIPSSVTNLNETFRDCTSIDGIYIINAVTPPTYFYSLSNVQAIYVPDASVDVYKSASGWIQFADKIYPMSEYWDGKFADPEVGRVLHDNGLIASPTHSTREELATITSLNPSGTMDGSYFYGNEDITQFPELQYCTGITNLSYTFGYCSSLTTAPVIPSSVTNMEGTFIWCGGLTSAPVIPESVTNMKGTFASCTNLTSAPTIPSSVTDLSYTFEECSSIDGIYIINIVTPISYIGSLFNVQTIYVPDASVSAYKSAYGWTQFADKIYPMRDKPQ